MEEAEVLCDRLGIFVDGQFQCIGNPKEVSPAPQLLGKLPLVLLVKSYGYCWTTNHVGGPTAVWQPFEAVPFLDRPSSLTHALCVPRS